MEKPKFLIWDEKRFDSFISDLRDAEKIFVISHTDLDGIAAAKVVEHALDVDEVFLIDYVYFNDSFIEMLKNKKPSHVIITDHLVKEKDARKIEKFAKLLIIDHHVPECDLNSERTVFLNAQEMCATYISYYLFSKIKDLDRIDWIVACACISDFLYRNVGDFMKKVFLKYGERFNYDNVRIGKFWDTLSVISMSLIYFSKNKKEVYDSIGENFGDLGNLSKYADIIRNEIDNCTKRFEMEKVPIKNGFYWEFSSKYPVKSWVINEISVKKPDITFIFGEIRGDSMVLSARRQDGKVDVRVLLKKLVSDFEGSDAGGHTKASGGYINLKYKNEFSKRVMELQGRG